MFFCGNIFCSLSLSLLQSATFGQDVTELFIQNSAKPKKSIKISKPERKNIMVLSDLYGDVL